MHTFIQDTNAVTSTEAEIFRVLQSSPIKMAIVIKNAGSNNLDYQFQESSDGQTWSDIASSDGTLTPSGSGQVAFVTITSSLAMVRLMCVSTSGSTIDFSVARYFTRAAGGPLPLLSF